MNSWDDKPYYKSMRQVGQINMICVVEILRVGQPRALGGRSLDLGGS